MKVKFIYDSMLFKDCPLLFYGTIISCALIVLISFILASKEIKKHENK